MMQRETWGHKERNSLMLKRTIPLLIAFAVVLSIATPAQAHHCARCRFSIDMQWCQFGTAVGSTGCYLDELDQCHETGPHCNHLAAVTPLSSEYSVASVEHIDEAPAPNETLVANLDVPRTAAEAAH
jgi:hypothetical protein